MQPAMDCPLRSQGDRASSGRTERFASAANGSRASRMRSRVHRTISASPGPPRRVLQSVQDSWFTAGHPSNGGWSRGSHMVFRRTDRRLLRVALVAAIPSEIADLWLLDLPPLKLNDTWLNLFEFLGVMVAAIMHYPAEILLPSTAYFNNRLLTQAILFLVGYIDLILLLFVTLLLYRIFKWCILTKSFGSG
jgi:hypothetical protein